MAQARTNLGRNIEKIAKYLSDFLGNKNCYHNFTIVTAQGGGGGGGTLIFSHIRRLGPFLGVQNSEFQYFLGFQKNEYFLGYEDYVDIFWGGHHKLG